MTTEQAIEVLTEMQKWRRSEPPYDEPGCSMPHDPKKWGEAVDLGIEALKQLAK